MKIINNSYSKYFFYLFLKTLFIALIFAFWNFINLVPYKPTRFWPFMLLFFFFASFFSYRFIIGTLLKSHQKFFRAYFISFALKFLISILIFVLFLHIDQASKISTTISFLSLYFLYSLFLTYHLIKTLKTSKR